MIGFAAVAWFIVEVYRAGLRNLEGWNRDWSRALGLAAIMGCTRLLVHSFFDFNLQIPAKAVRCRLGRLKWQALTWVSLFFAP